MDVMDEEGFVGCISCMGNNELCELFGNYGRDSYSEMFVKCFGIKVPNELKYLCTNCVEKLEASVSFREQTMNNIGILQTIKEEEYLDETLLEEEEVKCDELEKALKPELENDEDMDEEGQSQAAQNSVPAYPNSGPTNLQECPLCALALPDLADHLYRCHGVKSEIEGREYPCHFCENIYNTRKACFTHLRMKHGLKLYNDQTPKCTQRERQKCHLCSRDFSQKQILNKHLWKTHGIEVEKRKAFICPLCSERVSYGTHFSTHLLQRHRVQEVVEQLQFNSMDEFLLYKNAIQEETKYRYRKTTASKQTIDGIRSHYMCSQSGVYVYQGKGKRPAPERQIYKTGKACPAHMIVTETMQKVLVTFYKTHVGHGPCPYYEPREPKRPKLDVMEDVMTMDDVLQSDEMKDEDEKEQSSLAWICETCGMGFLDVEEFKVHITTHGPKLVPCQYCDNVFDNIETWTLHVQEHNLSTMY